MSTDGVTVTKLPFTGDGGVGGITLGPDGNVWFTESNSGQIGRVTPAGVVTEFDTNGGSGSAIGITAGPDGNLWFTDQANNQIGRITPDGVVTKFDTLRVGGEAPASSITLGPDGNLWYTKPSAATIGRITPDGVVTEFDLPGRTAASFITAGPDGNLWFTDSDNSQIGRMTTSGQVGLTSIGEFSFPGDIITGPDGRLWFTMRNPSRVAAFEPFAPAASAVDVSSVAPPISTTAGGNEVLITGYDVGSATAVLFGDTPASFTVVGPSQVRAVVPPHAAAQVDVTVVTPSGTTAPSPGSQFFYSSPACGRVITRTTRLTSDIGPCYGDGVRVAADNITLNLNGHRVYGFAPPSDGNAAGIRLTGRSAVNIRNGTVSGFDAGVVIDGGQGNSVARLDVRDNIGPDDVFSSILGDGIALFDSSNNRIMNNRVINNGVFDGIGIFGPNADNNIVVGNTVKDTIGPSDGGPAGQGITINGADGITEETISNTRVERNIVRRSGSAGIANISHIDGRILDNVIEDNGHTNDFGNGIGVSMGVRNTDRSTRMLIRGNKVHGNGWDGIQILDNYENRIIGNNASGNATDGVFNTFDLNDRTRTPVTRALECYSNVWSGNIWGSGGFNPPCTTMGGSAAPVAPASAAAASSGDGPSASAADTAQDGDQELPQRQAPSRRDRAGNQPG